MFKMCLKFSNLHAQAQAKRHSVLYEKRIFLNARLNASWEIHMISDDSKPSSTCGFYHGLETLLLILYCTVLNPKFLVSSCKITKWIKHKES